MVLRAVDAGLRRMYGKAPATDQTAVMIRAAQVALAPPSGPTMDDIVGKTLSKPWSEEEGNRGELSAT
jgi:hypothetical protein